MLEIHVVMGVDGCSAGWLCFRLNLRTRQTDVEIFPGFADVINGNQKVDVIAVDIPVGLPDSGSRDCDLIARRLLGKPRSSSVFPPPARSALIASNYLQASTINRRDSGKGLTTQANAIREKIREVDDEVTSDMQSRIHEVHPELCFWAMNEMKSLRYSKRKAKGREERQELLSLHYRAIKECARGFDHAKARVDDLWDAASAAWTAERIGSGKACRIPQSPQLDGKGLRMEIWY